MKIKLILVLSFLATIQIAALDFTKRDIFFDDYNSYTRIYDDLYKDVYIYDNYFVAIMNNSSWLQGLSAFPNGDIKKSINNDKPIYENDLSKKPLSWETVIFRGMVNDCLILSNRSFGNYEQIEIYDLANNSYIINSAHFSQLLEFYDNKLTLFIVIDSIKDESKLVDGYGEVKVIYDLQKVIIDFSEKKMIETEVYKKHTQRYLRQ